MTENKITYSYGVKGINYICNKQLDNGFWSYSEQNSKRYVDNFHTAYILLSIYICLKDSFNKIWYESFYNGLNVYVDQMFKRVSHDSIRPIHFHPNWIPRDSNIIQKVDLRDSATAIILFSIISQEYPSYINTARSILNWTNNHMKYGLTYMPEITWLWKNKIPYLEYQSWMMLALAVHEWHMNKGD